MRGEVGCGIFSSGGDNDNGDGVVVVVVFIEGVMVCGQFSWHTLGRLVPIKDRLNAAVYDSVYSSALSLEIKWKLIITYEIKSRPHRGILLKLRTFTKWPTLIHSVNVP